MQSALILWGDGKTMAVVPISTIPKQHRAVGRSAVINNNSVKIILIGDESELHQSAAVMQDVIIGKSHESSHGNDNSHDKNNNNSQDTNNRQVNSTKKRSREGAILTKKLITSNKMQLNNRIINEEPIIKRPLKVSDETEMSCQDFTATPPSWGNQLPYSTNPLTNFTELVASPFEDHCQPSNYTYLNDMKRSPSRTFCVSPLSPSQASQASQATSKVTSTHSSLPSTVLSSTGRSLDESQGIHEIDHDAKNDSLNVSEESDENAELCESKPSPSSIGHVTEAEYLFMKRILLAVEVQYLADKKRIQQIRETGESSSQLILTNVTYVEYCFMKRVVAHVENHYWATKGRNDHLEANLKLSSEFLQAREDKVEMVAGCGIFLPKNIYSVISLRYPPENDWKSFTRSILLEVYGNTLSHYTARGHAGKLGINSALIRAICQKINENRLTAIENKMIIRYINQFTSNKRNYERRSQLNLKKKSLPMGKRDIETSNEEINEEK